MQRIIEGRKGRKLNYLPLNTIPLISIGHTVSWAQGDGSAGAIKKKFSKEGAFDP